MWRPEGAAPDGPIPRDVWFYLMPAAAVVAAVLAFFPSLFLGFTNWDDADYITKCTYIKYLTWENVWFFLTQPYFSNYHPITSLSYMLEYRLWKLNPFGYHAVNVGLHAANALLVYVFALVLTRRPVWAGFAALLFAVHPQRVEVVAWLAARKDLLCTFFFLPSVIFWVWYARTGRRGHFWASLGFFVLALLSKPMAITLPAVILLVDYLVGRRLSWRLLWEKAPFYLASVVSAILTVFAQSRGGSIRTDITFHWWIKLQTVAYGFLFYLGKWVWPSQLSPLYAYGSTEWDVLPPAAYFAPFLLLAGVAVSCYLIGRSRWWAFGILCYVVMLLPVIQIVPIGQAYAADRYTYLPMIGLAIAVAVTLGQLAQKWKPAVGRMLAAGSLGVLAVFGSISWQYSKVWNNGMTLWEYGVKVRPYTSTAFNNLGAEYMQRMLMVEAYAALNRAIGLYPLYALAYNNRGNYYAAIGDLPRALEDYQTCLAIAPNSAAAENNIGTILGMLGRHEESIEAYSRAIALNRFYAEAYLNRGMAYRGAGDMDRALSDMISAVEVNPNLALAYMELGTILHATGRAEESEAMYQLALRYAPGDPEVLMTRGTAYKDAGRYEEAAADFESAYQAGLHTEQVINNWAASLAELGRHEKAVEIYTLGLEAAPDLPPLLANRGASYLRMKRFEEARRDLDRAIEVYPRLPMAWKTRGILNSTEQKIPEAIEDFNKALELVPDFKDARINRAANYFILRQYDKAWEDVRFLREQGVELQPGFIRQLQEASGISE